MLREGDVVYGVRTSTVEDPGSYTLYCPVCDYDGVGSELARALVDDDHIERVCMKEWLTGRPIQGGIRFDYESCLCFVSSPFEKESHPDKTDQQRRFFMWMGIAKEIGMSGKGVRAKHAKCVLARVRELYGEFSD